MLPDEAEYTKALSLSRLTADLESVASPILAAVLLGFMAYNNLFAGTALGFVLSAALVVAAALPALNIAQTKPFFQRVIAGLNLFVHTPRLRALVALSLTTAAGGAMAFVNTVVLVQSDFAMCERATTGALAVFGAGSIFAALALPKALERLPDRFVPVAGATLIGAGLTIGAFLARDYATLLGLWALLGAGYSLTLTPVGRVLRRSSHAEDRSALFAAQFALSHAAWLIAYPLAGFVSASFGSVAAFGALAMLCAVGKVATLALWPADDPEAVAHTHDDLPLHHPHLQTPEHRHAYVIDELHPRWPSRV